MAIPLLCTVRGCALPLERDGSALRCARNHSFDVARSGYANLLQPQDRRAAEPGDRKEAVAARRRLAERGYGSALFDTLLEVASSLAEVSAVLDVGCGEGSHLGRLAETLRIDADGIDISAVAIALAAKRYPAVRWTVANADRWLPYPDGAFDLVTSITARRPAAELARVVRSEGHVFVAVPAPDDLVELREAVQGEKNERSRIDSVRDELAGGFELVEKRRVHESAELDRSSLHDLLEATYRGLRHRERERAAALDRLTVTLAWDVLLFRRR